MTTPDGPGLRAVDPRARSVLVLLASLASFFASLRGLAVLVVAGLCLAWPLLRSAVWRRRLVTLVVGGATLGFLINWIFWPPAFGASAWDDPERLAHALRLGLRVASLGLFLLAFSASTPHGEVVEALGAMLSPASRVFGNGIHTALLQLRLALGFVPTFFAEGERILVSQKLRGLRVEGPPWRRAGLLAPVFIPVFALTLVRAYETGQLLLARGYRPGMARAYLVSHRWRVKDTAAVLAGAAWIAFALAV